MATSELPQDPREYDRWFRDRKPDPFVEGLQFEAWIAEFGISENQLHKIIGRPRDYIQPRRKTVYACPELRPAFDSNQVTWTEVRAIVKGSDDHDVQRTTLAMVLKKRKQRKTINESAILMFARGAASMRALPNT